MASAKRQICSSETSGDNIDSRKLSVTPIRALLFSWKDDYKPATPASDAEFTEEVNTMDKNHHKSLKCLPEAWSVKQRAERCKRNLFKTTQAATEEHRDIVFQEKPKADTQFGSQADVVGVLERASEQVDLVGDYSRPHTLPLVQGKRADLKAISPQTLATVLRGDYASHLGQVVIVDCRYPFEYQGGHIEGALNVYTQEAIIEIFFKSEKFQQLSHTLPTALIFHCEFSSERGPKMLRYLREQDRSFNSYCYPSLNYPEIYLLEGGYKAFWEGLEGSHCSPSSGYVPMLHEGHLEEVKFYRAINKSTAKGNKRQRSKKFQCIVEKELAAATRILDF